MQFNVQPIDWPHKNAMSVLLLRYILICNYLAHVIETTSTPGDFKPVSTITIGSNPVDHRSTISPIMTVSNNNKTSVNTKPSSLTGVIKEDHNSSVSLMNLITDSYTTLSNDIAASSTLKPLHPETDNTNNNQDATPGNVEDAKKVITPLPAASLKPDPKSEDAKLSLLEFGNVYGQQLTKWLSHANQISVSDEKASYEKNRLWLGKFTLQRGFIAVNVNAVFQADKLRKRKLSDPPKGTIKSVEVYYRYLIPNIAITYNFTQQIWKKNLTGHFNIILENQIIEAWLTGILNSQGKCEYKDRGFDITFDMRDYSTKIKFDGEGFVKKAMTYTAQKILNTYIVKWLLPNKVKKAMLGKLNDLRKQGEGKENDFEAKMEDALCNNFDDL